MLLKNITINQLIVRRFLNENVTPVEFVQLPDKGHFQDIDIFTNLIATRTHTKEWNIL